MNTLKHIARMFLFVGAVLLAVSCCVYIVPQMFQYGLFYCLMFIMCTFGAVSGMFFWLIDVRRERAYEEYVSRGSVEG